MYYVEAKSNDILKKMAERYLEKMTLKVGHVWIQGRQDQLRRQILEERLKLRGCGRGRTSVLIAYRSNCTEIRTVC